MRDRDYPKGRDSDRGEAPEEGNAGIPSRSPEEEDLAHERARNDVLKAIKRTGWFWPGEH